MAQDRYQNNYRSHSGVRECHIEVELSMDKTIEEGHNNTKMEVISGEGI